MMMKSLRWKALIGLCSFKEALSTMIVINRWLCFYVLLTALPICKAQTLSLDTLYVTETKTHDSISVQKLADGNDLKSTLLSTSHVSLNLQGVNSLATVINRGLPSKLFGVVYHGLRLNSINNSTYDINLLPTFYFNNTSINSAGNLSSAVYNSAAGMLDLKQKNNSNSISYGQFYRTNADVESNILWSAKNTKSEFSIGGNILNYNNSFDYYRSDIKYKSENNTSKGYNILTDVSHQFNNESSFAMGLWLQDVNRDLPEIYHRKGDQRQSDQSLRTYVNYSTLIKERILKFNVAYADEDLIYQTTSIHSKANTQSIMTTATVKTKELWQFQFGNKYDKAKANFFLDTKYRNDFFTSLSKKVGIKNVMIDVLLIQHYVDNKLAPIAGEVSVRKNDLKITAIKNYTLPGFNDLYWPIGGNIDLKAERSWQLTADYSHKLHRKLMLNATAYSYRISDFIQWLPTDQGYWSPTNVRKIWSRGLEASLDFQSKVGSYVLKNTYLYSFTKSTYEDSKDQKGKQLIYVPKHKMSNTMTIGKNNLNLLLSTVLTGKRYESTDNFTSLDPFLILNTKLDYTFRLPSWVFKMGLGIENISNENYEFVSSYPMPLRRYMIDIKINFNHKKITNEIN